MSDLLEKIIQAKEIKGDESAHFIAEHYHMEKFDPKALKGCCIFHHENTPSMIWNKKDLCFTCFGCGKRFSILDAYIDIEGSYSKALTRLFKETNIEFNPTEVHNKKNDYFTNYKYPAPETNADRKIVEEYLHRRGISNATMDYMGIKQDTHGNIVFECYDTDDSLLCVKYRLSRHARKGESKMWWQKNASTCPILYGINKIDITKPLLIVEGYVDQLSCVEAGYRNVVSIPHGANDTNWIEFNYDFLENFEEIILWFDNDTAGQKGLADTISRLGEYRCKVVKPSVEHEDTVEAYYKKFNRNVEIRKTDANNILIACGGSAIMSLIQNAEEIPSKRLKFLMDYDITNVNDMEKTSTGFDALDKLLYGNLFPCFTIYSGYAGSGKSSIANIASIIAPIEAGYKAFVFSGELDAGQLADWIVSPLAGYNHIFRWEHEGQRDGFSVSKGAEKAIKEFYRPKIILYDDEDGLDTSGDTVLSEMENAYKRYGCRTFLIDNLMCLSFDNLDSDSKWDSQKKFIIRLMNFTKKYKVCTNLILHPRKPSQGQGGKSVYDLHGASEIGNLCHRMIWVDKLNDDPDGYNLKLEIIKDRPSQSAGKSCKLYYDFKTRRIYSNDTEKFRPYSWEEHYDLNYNDYEKSILIKNNRGKDDFPL